VSSSAISTHGRVEILQSIARPAAFLSQIETQTSGHVVHVTLSLVQIPVVDIVEDGGQFIERTLDRPLGVDALIANDRRGPAQQRGIVEHEQLRVEYRRQVGTFELGDAPAESARVARAIADVRARAPTTHGRRDRGQSETE
jgi:hypothetical protein